MTSRIAWWALIAALAGLAAPAIAADKSVRGYESLGVGPGRPGGRITMVLGDGPQSFFYYGVIDGNLHTLASQIYDGLVEYNLRTYELEPALAEAHLTDPAGRLVAHATSTCLIFPLP